MTIHKNEERADFALEALLRYKVSSKPPPSDGMNLVAGYLLTDIMHLFLIEGWDFPEILKDALDRFQDETMERLKDESRGTESEADVSQASS